MFIIHVHTVIHSKIHFPLKTGVLFSLKAFRASTLSSVGMTCKEGDYKVVNQAFFLASQSSPLGTLALFSDSHTLSFNHFQYETSQLSEL